MQYSCISATTLGTAASCCCWSGRASRCLSAEAYSNRTPLRPAATSPEAVMLVDSSPSSRRCLPLVELLPNQAEKLRQARLRRGGEEGEEGRGERG